MNWEQINKKYPKTLDKLRIWKIHGRQTKIKFKKVNEMILDNSRYYNQNIQCSTCGKEYNPVKDYEVLEALNVPPLVANIFCSRVCKEKYDEFLSTNK